MTDYIHDFPLNVVTGYTFTRKEVKVEGYETLKRQIEELSELFSHAAYNVLYKERPSSTPFILDLTSDQRNIVRCIFSTEELKTAWYALKSFSYSPIAGRVTHYPFHVTLYFIGTSAAYQRDYELKDLESVTNDWNI